MLDPQTTFERWFIKPIAKLREIPNGDGGFVALAISCFLYERYAVAVIKKSDGKADKERKVRQFMIDFETDEAAARAFWDVVRDGILHQAMPKQSERDRKQLPVWAFHSDFRQPVELGKNHLGDDLLMIEPWRFADKVVELWLRNLDLLDQSVSFPWANVGPILWKPNDGREE